MQQRKIIHVDMDAFFAAVAQGTRFLGMTAEENWSKDELIQF